MDSALAGAVAVTVFGAIGYGVVLLRRGAARMRRRLQPLPAPKPDASWARTAREHGGRYDNGTIHIDDAGAHVVVSPWTDGSHAVRSWVTRASARYVSGAGPRFRLTLESFFTRAGKAFGGRDPELGRWPPFDHAYFVSTPCAELVREAWPPELMKLALERVRPVIMESDGESVTITVGEWLGSRDRLDACIELTGALARADVFGASALRKLPGATGLPTRPRWNHTCLPEVALAMPQRVRVGTIVDGGRVRSFAAIELLGEVEPYTVRVPKYGAPTHTGGALPGLSLRAVARLGPGELRAADGELRYVWARLQHDPATLLAGARLLTRATHARHAPFR